jgi:hypothetical protein
MHQGRRLALDEPRAILDRFADRLFEALVDDVPKARRVLSATTGVRRVYPAGEALKVAFGEALPPEAVPRVLAEQGVTVRSWQAVRPNFEDVFLAAVEPRA